MYLKVHVDRRTDRRTGRRAGGQVDRPGQAGLTTAAPELMHDFEPQVTRNVAPPQLLPRLRKPHSTAAVASPFRPQTAPGAIPDSSGLHPAAAADTHLPPRYASFAPGTYASGGLAAGVGCGSLNRGCGLSSRRAAAALALFESIAARPSTAPSIVCPSASALPDNYGPASPSAATADLIGRFAAAATPAAPEEVVVLNREVRSLLAPHAARAKVFDSGCGGSGGSGGGGPKLAVSIFRLKARSDAAVGQAEKARRVAAEARAGRQATLRQWQDREATRRREVT